MNKKYIYFITGIIIVLISLIVLLLEVVPDYYIRVVDKTTKLPIKNAITVINYEDGMPSIQGVVPGRKKNIIVVSDDDGFFKVDRMWYIHFLFPDYIQITIKEPMYETQREFISQSRPGGYFANHGTKESAITYELLSISEKYTLDKVKSSTESPTTADLKEKLNTQNNNELSKEIYDARKYFDYADKIGIKIDRIKKCSELKKIVNPFLDRDLVNYEISGCETKKVIQQNLFDLIIGTEDFGF